MCFIIEFSHIICCCWSCPTSCPSSPTLPCLVTVFMFSRRIFVIFPSSNPHFLSSGRPFSFLYLHSCPLCMRYHNDKMGSTYVREHGLSRLCSAFFSYILFFQSSLFFISQFSPLCFSSPRPVSWSGDFPVKVILIHWQKKKSPFLGREKCLVVEHSPSIRTTHTTESWQRFWHMYF